MKIASPDILHKTDIGGIKLNVRSETEVRDACDLLVYRARRFMPDATIWGATGFMVHDLLEIMRKETPWLTS